MTTIYRYSSSIALLLLVALLAGCGGSTGPRAYRVEGTVMHDGAPVEGAVVSFNPTDATISSSGGRTDASGRYTLMTSFGAVGAEAGTYNVTVTKREGVPTGRTVASTDEHGNEVQVPEMVLSEPLPQRYASAETTPFQGITVEAKSLNTIDFNLE